MEFGALEAYRDRRVLVLGASGFIGRWVARALTDAGARLFLAVRDEQSARRVFSNYRIRGQVEASDLSEPARVADLHKQIAPDITFNLAGYGVDPLERDEAPSFDVNASLPGVLARTALEAEPRSWPGQAFVHAGSGIEYGFVTGTLVESAGGVTTTTYAKSKLEGTLAVAEAARTAGSARALTARLFTVYGPGEHRGRLLPSLIEASKKGDDIELTGGTQRRDFTFVADAAEAMLRLGALSAAPAIVNVATGSMISVREFVEIAARILAIRPTRLKFGVLPTRSDEMQANEVGISRLRELTGWSPSTDPASGVRRTLKFENSLASAADVVSVPE